MKPSSPCHFLRAASAASLALLMAGALGACSSRGHELVQATACPTTPTAAVDSARAGHEVGTPYFGAEYADQESALHARVADDVAPSF